MRSVLKKTGLGRALTPLTHLPVHILAKFLIKKNLNL